MTISTANGEFAIAPQYAKYEQGTVLAKYAKSQVILLGVPAVNDTVAINGTTYTWKSSVSTTASQVLIGADKYISAVNLAAAINATASGSGILFGSLTAAHTTVSAEASQGIVFLTQITPSLAGNAYALVVVGVNLTALNGAYATGSITFTGVPVADETVTVNGQAYTWKASVTTTAYEVKIGADATISATNLKNAIIAGTGSGTTYGSLTVVHPTITATSALGVITLTAKKQGTAGNALTIADTSTNVTVSASTLLGGLAGSFAGGLDGETFDETLLTWTRMRVTDLDYTDVQMEETIDPEIGRVITPTGAYKSGVAVSGGATMKPRLKNSLGTILYCALGKCVTVDNLDGSYTHTFTYDSADEQFQPWVAVRSMIPGTGQVDGLGLIGYDNKVAAMRIVAAAARPIEARVDFMGRVPIQDHHPDVWPGSTFEDFTTAALACKGTFKLPTISAFPIPLPVPEVTVELSNSVTTPREEMVVGSYYMSDIITRFRALSLRFMYKWNDSAMKDYLFGNANRAVNWDPTPFRTVKASTNYAFDLLLESAALIASTATPYSLRVRASDTFWEPGAPVRLRGGSIVTMEVRGTVLAPSTGAYCEFILTNDTPSYSLPVQS